jgi:predicted transcriptional regulator
MAQGIKKQLFSVLDGIAKFGSVISAFATKKFGIPTQEASNPPGTFASALQTRVHDESPYSKGNLLVGVSILGGGATLMAYSFRNKDVFVAGERFSMKHLPKNQYHVLYAIQNITKHKPEGASVEEIQQAAPIKQSVVASVLDDLMAEGLIEREYKLGENYRYYVYRIVREMSELRKQNLAAKRSLKSEVHQEKYAQNLTEWNKKEAEKARKETEKKKGKLWTSPESRGFTSDIVNQANLKGKSIASKIAKSPVTNVTKALKSNFIPVTSDIVKEEILAVLGSNGEIEYPKIFDMVHRNRTNILTALRELSKEGAVKQITKFGKLYLTR